jgi:hypothetical protein
MATYSGEDIRDTLHAMCAERLARKPSRARGHRSHDDDRDARDHIQEFAVFVKMLGRSMRDVGLIGAAEFVCMALDDTDAGCSVAEDGVAMPPELNGGETVTYPSEQVKRVLEEALAQHGRGQNPRDIWSDDWIENASLFVKRLALPKSDLELIGAAEVAAMEVERRHDERAQLAQRAHDEHLHARAEEAERRWTEADAVTVSMLGARLSPPLRSVAVNKLLAHIGIQGKVPDKGWILTSAGVPFSKSERASAGAVVEWNTWSKGLLPLLQAQLDQALSDAEPRPSPRDRPPQVCD